MPRLQRLRALAFHDQHGRCFYCRQPMWLRSPAELGIPWRLAAPLQCTAEHLVARKDGGRDTRENIVAACRQCNQGRHRRKAEMTPGKFGQFVRQRQKQGRWWSVVLAGWIETLSAK